MDIFKSVVLGNPLLFWQPDIVVFMRFVQAFTWSVFSFSSWIRRVYMLLHMNSFTVCTGMCVCFCSACRRINCCQGHQGGWNWWWWHHTKWLSPPVVSATVPDSFWFQLSKSILSFLWILSFEIWRGWLLHQRSVDHRLAQEVWHRGDSLPLQETLWWTGVFRGAGSYHWKPGCHGNK